MNLVERAKAIVVNPRAEWPVIESEPSSTKELFTGYVAILALIPAACGFIGTTVVAGTTSVSVGLMSTIVAYVLTFVMVYLIALIVDLLAPTFGGRRDFLSALKLVVYSYTPGWLAGVFLLLPGLSFLAILGLYGIYLLWTGIPTMMKSPPERALVYLLAIVACALVLALVVGVIQVALFVGPAAA